MAARMRPGNPGLAAGPRGLTHFAMLRVSTQMRREVAFSCINSSRLRERPEPLGLPRVSGVRAGGWKGGLGRTRPEGWR